MIVPDMGKDSQLDASRKRNVGGEADGLLLPGLFRVKTIPVSNC